MMNMKRTPIATRFLSKPVARESSNRTGMPFLRSSIEIEKWAGQVQYFYGPQLHFSFGLMTRFVVVSTEQGVFLVILYVRRP